VRAMIRTHNEPLADIADGNAVREKRLAFRIIVNFPKT